MALLSLVASIIPSWYTLQWVASLITCLQLPLWFLISESPRWLLASGRNREAARLVASISKANKRPTTALEMKSSQEEKEEQEVKKEEESQQMLGLRDLFKQPLLTNTLIMFVCWPTVTLVYYGITFSMANLSDNLFADFTISSVVEIPG